MARQPTGNPTGRPPKPIDWTQFEQLCALQCTQTEIGNMFQVDEDTIRSRVEQQYGASYSVVYKKFSEAGKSSLRRNQFVLSKKNASMAIWLGKVWLGQKDPQCEETKDILEDARAAIREIRDDRRIRIAEQPLVEDQQPLLNQECGRQEDPIRIELGTENPVGGDA